MKKRKNYIKSILGTLALAGIFVVGQVYAANYCCGAESLTKQDKTHHCCVQNKSSETKITADSCKCHLTHSEPIENNRASTFIITKSDNKNSDQASAKARNLFFSTYKNKSLGNIHPPGLVYSQQLYTSVLQFKALQHLLN